MVTPLFQSRKGTLAEIKMLRDDVRERDYLQRCRHFCSLWIRRLCKDSFVLLWASENREATKLITETERILALLLIKVYSRTVLVAKVQPALSKALALALFDL